MPQPETLAESLRRQAERFHTHADNTLANCRFPQLCDVCIDCAAWYRRQADDLTTRAVRQDIVMGRVYR